MTKYPQILDGSTVPRKKSKRGLAVLIAGLAGLAGCTGTSKTTTGNGNSATTSTSSPSTVASPAGSRRASTKLPDTMLQSPLKTLDGKEIKLADYAGKVLVVDLWAVWCGHCRDEIPHLMELKQKYGDKIEVLGVAVDFNETDQQLADFRKELKISYPLVRPTPQMLQLLMQGNGAIPQTFVIGRDGTVLIKTTGFDAVRTVGYLNQYIQQGLIAS